LSKSILCQSILSIQKHFVEKHFVQKHFVRSRRFSRNWHLSNGGKQQ
jgi:hypothetical protein